MADEVQARRVRVQSGVNDSLRQGTNLRWNKEGETEIAVPTFRGGYSHTPGRFLA